MAFYEGLRLVLRLSLDVFFRTTELEGLDNVPEEGPLVLAANHPNTFLDVVLVGAHLPRRLNFVAKAPLFKNPLQGLLLRSLGAVPIERRMERGGGELDEAAREKNAKVLAECEETVARGGAIVIFPEGTSHEAPQLLPLKTGMARIALGAQARAGEAGVVIVPVGLSYDDPQQFRSRARVSFGPPIAVAPYAAIAKEDESRAVRALTQAIRDALEPEVVHVEDPALAELVRDLDALYGRRLAGSNETGRLGAGPAIARAVNHFSKTDPARVERMKAELHGYRTALEAAGLDDRAVRPGDRRPGIEATFTLVATAPLALWGFLHHVVPYQLPRLVAKTVTTDPTAVSSIKLAVGLVLFPLWYALETWAALGLLPTPLAIAHAGVLPIAGLVALLSIEALESRGRLRARDRARARAGPEAVRALRTRREAIVQELDRARAELLAALAPG